MPRVENTPSAYDFDPKTEPATVEVQLLPQRYVRCNGNLIARDRIKKERFMDDGVTVATRIEWDENSGRLWCPPRIANMLTTVPKTSLRAREADAKVGPLATVVGNRTVEEALESVGMKRVPKKDKDTPTE